MSRTRTDRAMRLFLEFLERRTVLSAVVAGPFAQDLWPNGQIPYVIDPSIKDPSGIIQAINEYNDETTTQWIPRTNQTGYVDFEYSDLPGLDAAQVGCQLGVEQYASLNNPDLTYVVLHEMGHALGFWHEQEMLDASSYIIINYQNLLPAAASLWAPMPAGTVRDVGPFDYSSIMLYNGYVGSANGLPVATELNGTPLPQNTALSADDIATIDTLYPVRAGQAQVARNVTASDVSTSQIQITWTDTNGGRATYTVECAGGKWGVPADRNPAGREHLLRRQSSRRSDPLRVHDRCHDRGRRPRRLADRLRCPSVCRADKSDCVDIRRDR